MGDGLLGFSIGQSWKTSQRRPSFSGADVGTPGKTWEKSAPNRRNSRCKYSEGE